MKQQAILPGIELPHLPPQPVDKIAGQETHAPPSGTWPPTHEMMGSLFVFELNHPKPVPVTVLGLGIHATPLTRKQRQQVEQAHVLAAGRPILDRLIPGWEHTDPPDKYYLPLQAPLASAMELLTAHHSVGRRVVVLADGDPLFFGIGGMLARHLGQDAVCIIPGLSSLQEACARMALPWHSVRCVSLHGRNDWRPLNVAVGSGKPVCVLTDADSTPDFLARHLLDRGVDWLDVRVCERLGRKNERLRCLSLREATALNDVDPASTVLLCPVAPPRRPTLGLPDVNLAVENGLVTKAPVRAAALSMLAVGPHHTVWDVGSGSGAVALEACALAHQGCVVAVERSPVRSLGIRENRRRFSAAILEVHTGTAPDCFDLLPTPDRVFVGGGLSEDNGEDILNYILQRLPPGGRVVASCVLMGTLNTILENFRRTGWFVKLACIQAAEGSALAGDVRLIPLNPVFLVSCHKPFEEQRG